MSAPKLPLMPSHPPPAITFTGQKENKDGNKDKKMKRWKWPCLAEAFEDLPGNDAPLPAPCQSPASLRASLLRAANTRLVVVVAIEARVHSFSCYLFN